jgi:formylglycine-generating enzyme required for sulfatase activity
VKGKIVLKNMPDTLKVEFEWVSVDPRGQIRDRHTEQGESLRVDLGENITFAWMKIPSGSLLMGAPNAEIGWTPAQSPQHPVTISEFWLAQYLVTQAQWQAVAALPKVNCVLESQPANFRGDDRPIEQVSWLEAVEFCDRLSQLGEGTFRLPSEAEWEYACRGQTQTPFHFGETITTDLANYSGIDWEYNGKICSHGSYGIGPKGSDYRETTAVGQFQVANRFGLFDMHGLLREWCADTWHDSYQDAPTDGSAWIDGAGDKRVVRSGSWNTGPRACRSAFRARLPSDSRLYDLGFRVVREI